ncbi:CRISPR-associated protein Cas5 [Haloplanus rallus]|uniref:CRISPR-associated protein Cas5 n=1 Tax=Haloplanus rallus TaxID=1816183 RepID=A0A6B9FGW2_9EURY|nr:CRISPR-associated protein Cas5 [Haloplanus rallus]
MSSRVVRGSIVTYPTPSTLRGLAASIHGIEGPVTFDPKVVREGSRADTGGGFSGGPATKRQVEATERP